MPYLSISVSNPQSRNVPWAGADPGLRYQGQPPTNPSSINKEQHGLICRKQCSNDPAERPYLKRKHWEFSRAIGVPVQRSYSPPFEVGEESEKPTTVSLGPGRGPHRNCVNGDPAGICPGFPSIKITRFEQTAAIQALKTVTGRRRGARLKPVARPSVWWEIQLKGQIGKPRTCQAPSHSSVARRSIKMSLSLGCRWLCYPVRWPLVIKEKKKQISFLHCSGLPLAFFKQ